MFYRLFLLLLSSIVEQKGSDSFCTTEQNKLKNFFKNRHKQELQRYVI